MRRWELTGSEYIEKMILVKLHWMEAIEKMEYCVLEKDKNAGKIAEQVITLMLQEYSRQLFGLTLSLIHI